MAVRAREGTGVHGCVATPTKHVDGHDVDSALCDREVFHDCQGHGFVELDRVLVRRHVSSVFCACGRPLRHVLRCLAWLLANGASYGPQGDPVSPMGGRVWCVSSARSPWRLCVLPPILCWNAESRHGCLRMFPLRKYRKTWTVARPRSAAILARVPTRGSLLLELEAVITLSETPQMYLTSPCDKIRLSYLSLLTSSNLLRCLESVAKGNDKLAVPESDWVESHKTLEVCDCLLSPPLVDPQKPQMTDRHARP